LHKIFISLRVSKKTYVVFMTKKVYKVAGEAVQQVRQVLAADHFARNGYILQDAKSLGIESDGNVLFVEAEPSFFEEHEKELLIEGVVLIEGEESDKAVEAIEKSQENVASGIALFD